MNFDEALDQILWWRRREGETKDTLVSLGLSVRVLFGKCKETDEEQWSVWSSEDWAASQMFRCPACGSHWITAERFEDWPFGS